MATPDTIVIGKYDLWSLKYKSYLILHYEVQKNGEKNLCHSVMKVDLLTGGGSRNIFTSSFPMR